MAISQCQVAVIGSGVYGLAAVSHLRQAGLETRIFGQAMGGWRCHMPEGMFIRTPWQASHIADPHDALTLDRFVEIGGMPRSEHPPLPDFVKYGLWFQGQVAPDLDQRMVVRVEPVSGGFRLTLEDGERIEAQRVVIATGLNGFAYRPPQFRDLPPSLVSHTYEHSELGPFAGQKILVIGGGLSAFEYAIQLHEVGVEVELVMRRPSLPWLDATENPMPSGPAKGLYDTLKPHFLFLRPRVGFGPPPICWIIASPGLVNRLPLEAVLRLDQWAERQIISKGSPWFRGRFDTMRITRQRRAVEARVTADSLQVRLDDGTTRDVDHMMLATGYKFDVSRYDILGPELVRSLRRVDGYPLLGAGGESSVPGLYFMGPIAQGSFGPVMYSIGGTQYAARDLTRYILRSVHMGASAK